MRFKTIFIHAILSLSIFFPSNLIWFWLELMFTVKKLTHDFCYMAFFTSKTPKPTQVWTAVTFSKVTDAWVSDQPSPPSACSLFNQTSLLHWDVYTCLHTGLYTGSTLAGFAIIHQTISGVTGTLDQSSGHLTLLGAASVILVTVALAGARTCVHDKTRLMPQVDLL